MIGYKHLAFIRNTGYKSLAYTRNNGCKPMAYIRNTLYLRYMSKSNHSYICCKLMMKHLEFWEKSDVYIFEDFAFLSNIWKILHFFEKCETQSGAHNFFYNF